MYFRKEVVIVTVTDQIKRFRYSRELFYNLPETKAREIIAVLKRAHGVRIGYAWYRKQLQHCELWRIDEDDAGVTLPTDAATLILLYQVDGHGDYVCKRYNSLEEIVTDSVVPANVQQYVVTPLLEEYQSKVG